MPPDLPTAPFSHRARSVKAEPRQRRGGRKAASLDTPSARRLQQARSGRRNGALIEQRNRVLPETTARANRYCHDCQ